MNWRQDPEPAGPRAPRTRVRCDSRGSLGANDALPPPGSGRCRCHPGRSHMPDRGGTRGHAVHAAHLCRQDRCPCEDRRRSEASGPAPTTYKIREFGTARARSWTPWTGRLVAAPFHMVLVGTKAHIPLGHRIEGATHLNHGLEVSSKAGGTISPLRRTSRHSRLRLQPPGPHAYAWHTARQPASILQGPSTAPIRSGTGTQAQASTKRCSETPSGRELRVRQDTSPARQTAHMPALLWTFDRLGSWSSPSATAAAGHHPRLRAVQASASTRSCG